MAINNQVTGGVPATGLAPTGDLALGTAERTTVITKTLDFSVTPVATGADNVLAIAIPAGFYVSSVLCTVVKPEGVATTAGVGDSSSNTVFLAAFDANVANNKALSTTASKLYTAADSIRYTPNVAQSVGKVRLQCHMTNTN